MSYEILLWKPRAGSQRSRAFVYFVLATSGSAECDGAEPFDAAPFEAALRAARPDGYTVHVSPLSVRVQIDDGADWGETLESVRRVASGLGLELFDAQAETTSEREKRAARAYLDAQKK